jgi:hypothetical protein
MAHSVQLSENTPQEASSVLIYEAPSVAGIMGLLAYFRSRNLCEGTSTFFTLNFGQFFGAIENKLDWYNFVVTDRKNRNILEQLSMSIATNSRGLTREFTVPVAASAYEKTNFADESQTFLAKISDRSLTLDGEEEEHAKRRRMEGPELVQVEQQLFFEREELAPLGDKQTGRIAGSIFQELIRVLEPMISVMLGGCRPPRQDHKPSVTLLYAKIASYLNEHVESLRKEDCGEGGGDEEGNGEDVKGMLAILSNVKKTVVTLSELGGGRTKIQQHLLLSLATMASGTNVAKLAIQKKLGLSRKLVVEGGLRKEQFISIAQTLRPELEEDSDEATVRYVFFPLLLIIRQVFKTVFVILKETTRFKTVFVILKETTRST